MRKNRYAARVDSNQGDIVEELRGRGFSVEPGHDDILVGRNGITKWYEIKTSEKASLKDSQKKLLQEFKGHYKVVWTVQQILEDFRKIK